MTKHSNTLIIKDGDIVEFEGIISFDKHHGKHFRVLKDEMNYEEMIRELIYKGYKKTVFKGNKLLSLDSELTQTTPIYEEILIEINTIDELVEFLSARSFECEVIPSNAYAFVASVSVDGQDIGYEVISNTNKSKVINFTLNLFKTVAHSVNNTEYEPIINEKAGSFEIEIFDTRENFVVKDTIISIITNLKNQSIDTQSYLKKSYYYNLVNSLLELSTINHLDILKVKFSENNFIKFTKDEVISLKSKVKELLSSLPFEFTIKDNILPRALDIKNLSFKLDTDEGVRYCHTEDQGTFDTLSDLSGTGFTLTGYYTSIKSVKITNIQRNS